MQDRVRELVLKVVFIQQRLHSGLDFWILQDLIYVWPLVGVLMQHLRQEVRDDLAEMGWDIGILALNDFLRKLMQTLGIERRLESAHFIQKHSQRPNIGFEGVWLRLDDFWRKIIGCSNHSLGFRLGLTEYPSDTEVSKLNHSFLG